MWSIFFAAFAADAPPMAIYPDDPPWRDVRRPAPDYAALHGWLHVRRAAGDARPAMVAVGSAAVRETAGLAGGMAVAWHGFPDAAAARAAGFAAPGVHWLWWDGPTLRHAPPAALRPVPTETLCPDGRCPLRAAPEIPR